MKVLNLYAGLGGNRKYWSDEHDITAVEMNPKIAKVYKNNFPNDNMVVGDAHEYLIKNSDDYDFIWGSPPCQSHSKMVKATRHKIKKYPDMGLYQEIIYLTHFFKGLWIIENVKPYYKPLIEPTLELGRHLIWSNFNISKINIPSFKNFITSGSSKDVSELKKWLGIDYDGNLYYDGNHCPGQVLRNCVHPDVGLHIMNCALNIKPKESTLQYNLFT
jgi:DNA (cytosine-5)-methyltransferase 1|tara:strand:- start:14672 stop:15322 length:651 start_codon:yes stop_codon:yes gene_type:complete